jgi:hypothetical protein
MLQYSMNYEVIERVKKIHTARERIHISKELNKKVCRVAASKLSETFLKISSKRMSKNQQNNLLKVLAYYVLFLF